MIAAPAAILEIDEIDLDVAARSWPFAADESAAIDLHWAKARLEKPLLFNGRVLLTFDRRIETAAGRRVLRGTAAPVDFKAFLAWRDFGFPDGAVCNCFAMAALLSADGAFLLGRMSEATANGGLIYFPAGTPDPDDVRDAKVDLVGSVARELAEETGLSPDEVTFAPDWTVVLDGPRIACMKLTRSSLTAAAIIDRFRRFIADQRDPELVALHPVFAPADLDAERMPGFTLRYLRHALAGRPQAR